MTAENGNPNLQGSKAAAVVVTVAVAVTVTVLLLGTAMGQQGNGLSKPQDRASIVVGAALLRKSAEDASGLGTAVHRVRVRPFMQLLNHFQLLVLSLFFPFFFSFSIFRS